MPPRPGGHSSEFAEMTAIIQNTIQAAITPLSLRIQQLEDKIDKLSSDHVTRADIEKLRAEMVRNLVSRDSYEPRHAALIDRNMQLETMIRELRKDTEDEFKKLIDMGSQSWQRMDMRIDATKELVEDKLKQQHEAQLSAKDRAWLRGSQMVGFVGLILAVLDLVLRLAHLQ
jgi:hypothetical protein